MDPHGPMVTWPHVIRTAPDQGDFPYSSREPRVMAHQEDDITHFPSFIEAPHASPPSLIKSTRRHPQDPTGIPQGIPLTSIGETPGIPPR